MSRKNQYVYIKVRYFLLICIIIMLAGCRLLNFSEIIEIRFPDTESDIFQKFDYHWILEYRDTYGSLQSIDVDAVRESLFLQVEKGQIRAFTIRAVILTKPSGNFTTKAAGFIYGSSSKSGGKYFFDWKSGFESSLLMDLTEFINPEKINIKRLSEVISEVSAGENHWIIDGPLIQEHMLSGDFNVYDIRKLRQRTIELKLPVGEWFNSNLLSDNLRSISSESFTTAEIPTGYSHFYHQEGLHLEIEMKSDGSFDYIIY
jgi:hypothetical protein